MDKLNLLTTKFPELIRSADPNVKPVFGKMNLQQMVEHMSDAVRMENFHLNCLLRRREWKQCNLLFVVKKSSSPILKMFYLAKNPSL